MRTTVQFRFAALLFALSLYGCGGNPVQPQPTQHSTTSSVVDTKQSVAATRAQLGETLASLNALMHAPAENLRQAYSRYASNVDEMRKREDAINKSINRMEKDEHDWLSAWRVAQRDIDNPEIRTISQARHEQLAARLEDANSSVREAGRTLTPFLNNLEDVRKALANDLTPSNVALIAQTEVIQSANVNGAAVARELDAAITDFNELTASLPPTPAK